MYVYMCIDWTNRFGSCVYDPNPAIHNWSSWLSTSTGMVISVWFIMWSSTTLNYSSMKRTPSSVNWFYAICPSSSTSTNMCSVIKYAFTFFIYVEAIWVHHGTTAQDPATWGQAAPHGHGVDVPHHVTEYQTIPWSHHHSSKQWGSPLLDTIEVHRQNLGYMWSSAAPHTGLKSLPIHHQAWALLAPTHPIASEWSCHDPRRWTWISGLFGEVHLQETSISSARIYWCHPTKHREDQQEVLPIKRQGSTGWEVAAHHPIPGLPAQEWNPRRIHQR